MDEQCPQCEHIRKLAKIKGVPFDRTHCMRCVPHGPRTTMMTIYVLGGVLACILLLMIIRPLSVHL